jgi:serine protease Do
MTCAPTCINRLIRISIFFSLYVYAPLAAPEDLGMTSDQGVELSLVRVNIITETRGAKDTVVIDGKLIPNYRPILVQVYSSTGIIFDDKGHIMAFLGYRWVDLQSRNPRIEIATGEKRMHKGKLVGIDQSNGVAVVRVLDGKLKKTPICTDCEIRDGVTVVAPIFEAPGVSQFQEAQVLSVSAGQGAQDPGWVMSVSRPFPDVGLPILSADHRVLGFVASQDPMGMRTIVYPISQLLSSAEKILRQGGDIRIGWLGVFILDIGDPMGPRVVVYGIDEDSPAQKAGLTAGDLLMKYNGQEVKDSLQFIRLVESTSIGSKVDLNIVRNGTPISVTASLDARKPPHARKKLEFSLPGAFGPPASGKSSASAPQLPWHPMGIGTEILTPPLADALRMPGQTGLLVVDVAKKMPADLAGIHVGDVIAAVDDQPVRDAQDLASYLLTHSFVPQINLKIFRKGRERNLTVRFSAPSPDTSHN